MTVFRGRGVRLGRRGLLAGFAGMAGAVVTASLAWACAPQVGGQLFFEPIPRVIECGTSCPTIEILGATQETTPETGTTQAEQKSVYQDMTAWKAEFLAGPGGPIGMPRCHPDEMYTVLIGDQTVEVTTSAAGTSFEGTATPQVSDRHPQNETRFYQVCSGFSGYKIRAMLGISKI